MTELEAKCLQPYMKTYSECEISYDSDLKVAILKGPQFKMLECQCNFLLERRKVKEIDIPLKKDVLSILSSEKGQNFLQHLSESELKSVFMELDSNSLKVAALDEAKLNVATKIIKEKVEYAESMEGKSDIPLEEIIILKLKIENQFKAKLNWDLHKTQLTIIGIKDDVLAARKEVEIFLEKYGVSEKSFVVGEPLAKNDTPKRGTLDFMQYASESDEHFPSYWSLNGSKSYWENIKSYWTSAQKRRHLIVDIDQETKDVIVNLVKKTFDRQLVKNDRLAEGLTHSSVKVINVQRVENAQFFQKYNYQRKKLLKKMLGIKKICPDIGKMQGSKGIVGTAKHLNEAMKKELFYEVNEHYLFYGTNNFEPVINFGLDPWNSSSDCLFGRGIYAAEISSVADVYTDSNDNRSPKGTPLTLILARVLLGNVFLCDHKNKHVAGKGNEKLSRPPCMSCLEERCSCHKQTLFDSVMGDGHWLYRQFIIYDGNQIYPEYIITYKRE